MLTTKRVATMALTVTALLLLCAGFAQPPRAYAAIDPSIGSVAQQLGVKVPLREDETFAVGVSFTGLLEKPDKLSAYGIAGMKQGARVVAARIAIDRVVVEVDQMEPARQARVKLAIDYMGRLATPPRT